MTSSFSDSTLLLTGGSGMVGSNVLEHPMAKRMKILAPSSKTLDLLDRAAVKAYFVKHDIGSVVHCAGTVGGIQANIARPAQFLVQNIITGMNIIQCAREAGIKNLVNLASSCIYPRHGVNPLCETQILGGELEPTNEGYALAKISVLKLCNYIRHEDPTYNYRSLIPCNIYGRFDSFHPEKSHLVPAIIRKIHLAKINNEDSVEIWGDGQARREFMYGADLADAIWRAIERSEPFGEMNIGMGSDHTILDYYRTAADIVGWSGSFIFNLDKPIGMKQKLVDISRQKQWGWSPTHNIEDGMSKTYKFFLEESKDSI